MYNSEITFTLDTVCPWTYIAKKRLEKALETVRTTNPPVNFTLSVRPFQLDPSFSSTPVSKAELHASRFGDRAPLLHAHLATVGSAEGINFKFGGEVANTLPAHRVLQVVREEKGDEAAWKVVGGLYRRHFEEEANPASTETLEGACLEAGLEEEWVKGVVGDEERGLKDVKKALRMADGVDGVPHIVFEGRKRDLTLVGAKEVYEYVKAVQTIIKESQ